MFVYIRSAAFIIVVTQKLVLQQSKNVTAKCTETLSPPPSIQFSLIFQILYNINIFIKLHYFSPWFYVWMYQGWIQNGLRPLSPSPNRKKNLSKFKSQNTLFTIYPISLDLRNANLFDNALFKFDYAIFIFDYAMKFNYFDSFPFWLKT